MTFPPNIVQHDAAPYDGHTYRLRLADGRELDAIARPSYSGANVVFAVLDEHGLPKLDADISERNPDLVAVERITTRPRRSLAATPTNLARRDIKACA